MADIRLAMGDDEDREARIVLGLFERLTLFSARHTLSRSTEHHGLSTHH
jgi:hypothetical protein